MMKRTICGWSKFILVALLAFTLCSCGNDELEQHLLQAEAEDIEAKTENTVENQVEAYLTFSGAVQQNGLSVPLTLSYWGSGHGSYFYSLTVGEESFADSIREDFMPETVHQGFELWDINEDGIEDILVDFGIFGKTKLGECFISTADGYQRLLGYHDLSIPSWSAERKMVREEWHSTTEGGVNFYCVIGTKLRLEASMQYVYEKGDGPWYTVKKREGNEMDTVLNHVRESKIELDEWYTPIVYTES